MPIWHGGRSDLSTQRARAGRLAAVRVDMPFIEACRWQNAALATLPRPAPARAIAQLLNGRIDGRVLGRYALGEEGHQAPA